jgi:hypothetical protein
MAQEALFRQGDHYALKKVKFAFLMPFYALEGERSPTNA